MYQLNRNDLGYVEFAFYEQNGKYHSSLDLEINGLSDYSNPNISVSPNGRYIFYVEEKESEENNRTNRKSGKELIGKVVEILSLRPKEEGVKLK